MRSYPFMSKEEEDELERPVHIDLPGFRRSKAKIRVKPSGRIELPGEEMTLKQDEENENAINEMATEESESDRLDRVDIIKYSLEKGAIKVNTVDPFVWASGYKMPVYNDNRILLSSPAIRNLVTKKFCDMIKDVEAPIHIIAGTATSGIPFASFLAEKLQLPLVYVRGSKKDYGAGNSVEGYLPEYKNKNAILIEDVISTGKSALRASERLTENGINVTNIFSVFNYNFISILKIKSIYTLVDLMSYMMDNYITKTESEEVRMWAKDPFNWRGKE